MSIHDRGSDDLVPGSQLGRQTSGKSEADDAATAGLHGAFQRGGEVASFLVTYDKDIRPHRDARLEREADKCDDQALACAACFAFAEKRYTIRAGDRPWPDRGERRSPAFHPNPRIDIDNPEGTLARRV